MRLVLVVERDDYDQYEGNEVIYIDGYLSDQIYNEYKWKEPPMDI